MAGICTNNETRTDATCNHRNVVINLDGTEITLHTSDQELDVMSWTAEDQRQFVLLGLKRLRVLGLNLEDALNRVTNGEEATCQLAALFVLVLLSFRVV